MKNILFIFFILIISCNNKESKKQNQSINNSFQRVKIKNDSLTIPNFESSNLKSLINEYTKLIIDINDEKIIKNPKKLQEINSQIILWNEKSQKIILETSSNDKKTWEQYLNNLRNHLK